MAIDEIEALISKNGSITAQPLMNLIVTVVLEAVEAEREACAKVCEIEAQEYGTDTNEWYVARACAVLIHSRGK